MKSLKPSGQCRLTGEVGAFVKSHLIPLALTRLSGSGEKFVEAGIGHGRKLRSNSWYDPGLVTRSGEDILADIDAVGIELLREHRLVWSSWGESSLQAERLDEIDTAGLFRFVPIQNPAALQLFFLSLLWRAGATSRPEFDDVVLRPDVLADLAGRILRRDAGSFMDYPVQLFQLSTKGLLHNRSPILERKRMIGLDGQPGQEVDYVRFYLDGLVAHVHLAQGVEAPDGYELSCLSATRATTVFLNTFSGSRTWRDMKEMAVTVDLERFTAPGGPTPLVQALVQAWPLTRPRVNEPSQPGPLEPMRPNLDATAADEELQCRLRALERATRRLTDG